MEREDMTLDELYYEGDGYKPLVLTKDWQLAQLNYAPDQAPESITKLDQHVFTDETFTLIKGRAFLIIYSSETKDCGIIPLKQGITYNVPVLMWHNIAMDKGSTVMITEGRDAHLKGLVQIPVPEEVKHKILKYKSAYWI